MWDNIKYISIHVMGVQKGEERKEQKNISKNNFGEKNTSPNLMKTTNLYIQDAQQTPEKF